MNEENIVVSPYVDYTEDIQKIIRSNLTPTRIREKLLEYHDNDIALSLDALKREERLRLYSALDTDALVSIFEYVENIGDYLEEIGISKRVNILSRIETSTAVEYLGNLEKKDRDVILSFMSEEAKSEVLMLASFDKDEIGSRMTTNYISVHAGIGVRKVMSELVAQAAENDNVSTIYVLDESDRFVVGK